MNMRMIITPVTAIALVTLSLSACSSSAPGSSASPHAVTTPAEQTASTEHSGAQPRVVVTTQSGVQVLQYTDGTLSPLSDFALDAPVRGVLGYDGRHVYLVDGEAGRTAVLDSGSYAQGHGDHFHYFTRDAAMRPDVIEGDTPIHVVGGDGRMAIFNDGDGTVSVFDEIGLISGGLNVSTLDAGGPHHGVAVPVHEGYLVTNSAEGGLPESVVQVDEDGQEVTRYDNVCPGLHGEAHVGERVVFGCSDSVAVIDPEAQTSTSIAYPAGSGENRVGSLYTNGEVLVGNWGAEGFVVIDLAAGSITPVSVGATAGAITVTGDGDIAVLTTDGELRAFDAHGDLMGSVSVMDAFELPEGHGGVRPALAVIGDAVIISDTESSSLVVVDLHDLEVLTTLALSSAPTGVIATGVDPTAGTHEDHDH